MPKYIRYLTEEQDLMLHNICEEYWKEFSQLVAKHLTKAPLEFQRELLIRLEDKSSVHGSDFERYLKKSKS